MNLQDQYGEAISDFSRSELARAIAKLQTGLVVKPALYKAQRTFGGRHSLFYVKAGYKPKAEHHVCKRASPRWAHRPIGDRRRVSRQSGIGDSETETHCRRAGRRFARHAEAEEQGLMAKVAG